MSATGIRTGRCLPPRWLRTAWLLCAVWPLGCGAARLPAATARGDAACAAGDVAGCERALLQAEPPRLATLLGAYDRALVAERGDTGSSEHGWGALWTALAAHPARPAVIHDGSHAERIAGLPGDELILAADLRPRSLPTEQLILTLAVAAKRPHVVVLAGPHDAPVAQHLLPGDLLAAHLPALPAQVFGLPERARLAADVELSLTLRRALDAARRFAYLAAAEQTERLQSLVATAPPDAEPTLRGRYGLSLLQTAGIALEPAAERPPESSPSSAPAGAPDDAPRSAQGEYLRVVLAGSDAAGAWSQKRAAIAPHLSADRLTLLDEAFARPGQCIETPPPPMAEPSDLVFAHHLSRALDPEPLSGSSAEAAASKLPLDEWLERYGAMVRLVARTGTTWAYASSLLGQRGEVYGLSPDGTTTYEQVTDLALRHVAALRELAEQEPDRFRPVSLLPLLYAAGVSADRAVREAIVDLGRQSVAAGLDRADDPEGLFDAAFAGLLTVMSFPPSAQPAQLAALRDAFVDELAGPIGAETGWTVAGLHAGAGLLGLLTGKPELLRQRASAVVNALGDVAALPYPELAELTVSASRYGALIGTPALDPSIANPSMFTADRKAARVGLSRALANLAPGGPTTAAERALLADAVALADGWIALVATGLTTEPPATEVHCAGESAFRERPDLADPVRRLLRLRRRLLERPAFERGDGPWLRRMRFAVVVLSDALDIAARRDALVFELPQERVEQVLVEASADWASRTWAEAVRGGYLLARAAIRERPADQEGLTRNVTRVLQALAAVFEPAEPATGERGASLFSVLAEASSTLTAAGPDRDLAELMVVYAKRSYATGAADRGDLLLFVALAVAVARERPPAAEAVELARSEDRPVGLPLVLNGFRSRELDGDEPADPDALVQAMRREQQRYCDAPDPTALIALRRAVHEARSGQLARGRAALDRWLEQAEQSGLVVPRLRYVYEETTADTVFKVEGSLSLAADYLTNSGTLQLGLGLRSGGEPGGEMQVSFAPTGTASADEEAARLYAHVAAIAAVYHFVAGETKQGVRAARRAVPAWAIGVRLGDERVAAGDRTATWVEDAPGVIAVAAQLALEANQIFLAGDLWTLVLAALGPEADDERVAELLEPVPAALRGIAELEPIVVRARASLRELSAPLPCAQGNAKLERLLRADCATYPRALAYRIANGLPALPRLDRGAEIGKPACQPLRVLDRFLAAAAQQRYDPDAFTAAVETLRRDGRDHDAAALLARQRHPQHCSPALVSAARELSTATELGPHLRADLLSLAANCSGGRIDQQLIDDLLALDRLTRQLPVPLRNLQLTIFVAQLALSQDEWKPLVALVDEPGFVRRWLRFGPELATGALLLHHAAQVMAGKPIDAAVTQPAYRLLCATFPPADRGPTCHAIGVLRSPTPPADKKQAAREALRELMSRLTVPRPPAATSPPP